MKTIRWKNNRVISGFTALNHTILNHTILNHLRLTALTLTTLKLSTLSLIILGLTALSSTKLQALELTYGKGDFSMGAAIDPFFSQNIALDINTWSLTEKHKNFSDSPVYYHFKMDYFNSDTANKITDFASSPLTTSLPFFGSSVTDAVDSNTRLPVPADYRIHGVNLDIGLGYDLIKDPQRTLGIAINTGLSTPFMKVRNMRNTANLALNLLDTFDTRIKTFKFGAGVYGEYKLKNGLTVSANTSFNKQTGEMDNDLVGSGIDIDGNYYTLNVGLTYKPESLKNFYLTAGYSDNKWNYDSATVNTPISNTRLPKVMDIEFDSNNLYLGLGYTF